MLVNIKDINKVVLLKALWNNVLNVYKMWNYRCENIKEYRFCSCSGIVPPELNDSNEDLISLVESNIEYLYGFPFYVDISKDFADSTRYNTRFGIESFENVVELIRKSM